MCNKLQIKYLIIIVFRIYLAIFYKQEINRYENRETKNNTLNFDTFLVSSHQNI